MTKLERLYALRARLDLEIEQEILRVARLQVGTGKKRRAKRIRRRVVAECGTDTGYYRHRRTLKEAACKACKAAHSRTESDRRALRKWEKAA